MVFIGIKTALFLLENGLNFVGVLPRSKPCLKMLDEISFHSLPLRSLLPSFEISFGDNYEEQVNGPFDNCTTDALSPRTHYGEI